MKKHITPDTIQNAAIIAIETFKAQFNITMQGSPVVEAFARQVMVRASLESELCGYQFTSEKN